jgi:hypothetical protein
MTQAAVERGGDRTETLRSRTDADRAARHYKRIARPEPPPGSGGSGAGLTTLHIVPTLFIHVMT